MGLGAVLARTLAHFWPKLPDWIDGLKDARDKERYYHHVLQAKLVDADLAAGIQVRLNSS